MTGYVSARYDFPEKSDVEKILIVASSYRSGSTMISLSLWNDGRFGAPFEYFNFEKHMDYMMARLNAIDVDEYVRKLMQVRTSPRGTFAVKAHFHHFESMHRRSKGLRDRASITKFIYVDRKDKLAQAVSMARALQDNAWISFSTPRQAPLFYSYELIDECLREVMSQCQGWWAWFDAQKIQPYVINYEEYLSDPGGNNDAVARWAGVTDDVSQTCDVPMIERQANSINAEWSVRFIADKKSKSGSRRTGR